MVGVEELVASYHPTRWAWNGAKPPLLWWRWRSDRRHPTPWAWNQAINDYYGVEIQIKSPSHPVGSEQDVKKIVEANTKESPSHTVGLELHFQCVLNINVASSVSIPPSGLRTLPDFVLSQGIEKTSPSHTVGSEPFCFCIVPCCLRLHPTRWA